MPRRVVVDQLRASQALPDQSSDQSPNESDVLQARNGDLAIDSGLEASGEPITKNPSGNRVLVLACGALAREIMMLRQQFAGVPIDLTCLPAKLHNTPQQIVPQMRAKLEKLSDDYDRIYIAYADCGTGGALDRLLAEYPQTERLPGAHCYASFAGQDTFTDLMEQELGTFYLTDYMVRHFDRLIIEGMGLDRHPELRDMYFAHYKKLVYLAQIEDPLLQEKAEQAADTLGLEYSYHFTGMGELASFIAQAQTA